MVCHVALPPQEMLEDAVAWDAQAGVFIIKVTAANDDAPPVGRGLVKVPPQPSRLFGIAEEDADALMRGLAGWGALFVGVGRLFRWI